ncbi:hypothetical protein DICVIV_11613 [Dictyocaulus viviparus]|uniref:Uncharacterized protein n=1 Tax=Dictyocaulus viviparus TaxID=29172 RepID=A0A0D8XJB0_DICVI|nr:hypothetical protein DICVIV_11613 [Dictyocaulus viviparus]
MRNWASRKDFNGRRKLHDASMIQTVVVLIATRKCDLTALKYLGVLDLFCLISAIERISSNIVHLVSTDPFVGYTTPQIN